MTKLSTSYFRRRIEEHFEDYDLDVVCHRKKYAFAIYWACDDEPLARLRPTGQDDEVEIYHWEDSRWQEINEFGLAMPLQQSLEYITSDPDDLFFAADEEDEAEPATVAALVTAMQLGFAEIIPCSLVGGAVGGLLADSTSGGTWGALIGMAGFLGLVAVRKKMQALRRMLLASIAVALVAAAGAVLGSSVNGLSTYTILGPACGFVLGGLASLLVFAGQWTARGIGFAVGLTLAARWVELIHWRDHFAGLVLVAVVASLSAKLFGALERHFEVALRPILASRLQAERDAV